MKRTAGSREGRSKAGLIAVASTMLMSCAAVSPSFAATLSLIVVNKEGARLPGVVVTAEPEPGQAPPALGTQISVDQVDLAFVPDVSVIPVGSSVSFPNSDRVSHQVYSFSPARRFQLPLYRGQQYPPVIFDQPGIVTLGCNIHDNMLAYVVVTDAPYFGRTNTKGEWVMRNAPAGSYRIKLWHPQLKEPAKMLERTVRLGVDGNEFELTIGQSFRPAPLKGHPHSWDY